MPVSKTTSRPSLPVYDAAVAALAQRPHSRAELGRKLARRGYEANEVAAALERAVAAGYLDDAAYARAVAERRSKQRGTAAIAAELRARGVAREDIDAALSDRDVAREQEAASRLAARGLAAGAGRRELERMAARLMRRGFSAEVAWAACRAAASAGG